MSPADETQPILTLVTDEALEQLAEDGREMRRYILTPEQWQQLEDELVTMGHCRVRPLRSLQLTLPGYKNPVDVIKGPP